MNRGFSMIELLIYMAIGTILAMCMNGLYKLKTSELKSGDATCQHVFVISSEYDWWFEQYKTVSRCAKCGMVI